MDRIVYRAIDYLEACEQLGRFSGSVLISTRGGILVSKGFGMADCEHKIPNTSNTRFHIGSLTKQFTSMAIMQLQADNILNVKHPLSRRVPDYPNGNKITLHHLLTHSSGIPDIINSEIFQIDKARHYALEELLWMSAKRPLEFQPGTKFKYSNTGYILLSYILEKATGLPYDSFVQSRIFKPSGMKDSTALSCSRDGSNDAIGYCLHGSDLIRAEYRNMSTVIGCGGIVSTVEDLHLWHRALYAQEILDRRLMEQIFTPFRENYAYGWRISELFHRKLAWHNGGIEGFKAGMYRFVDDDACIILLSNFEQAWETEIARDLAAIVFGQNYQLPKGRDTVQLDPERLNHYAGQYQFSPSFVVNIAMKGDQLFIRIPDQPPFEILPASQDAFFMKASGAEFTFVRATDGEIKHLILHQMGQHLIGSKIEKYNES